MKKQDTVTGVNHGDNYCFYYLHVNGSLIHKPKQYNWRDFEESDLVKKWWIIDMAKREDGYNFLIAASINGANQEQINELGRHWKIDDEDCDIYIERFGLEVEKDGDVWCVRGQDFVNIMGSPCGFGETKFIALTNFYESAVHA